MDAAVYMEHPSLSCIIVSAQLVHYFEPDQACNADMTAPTHEAIRQSM